MTKTEAIEFLGSQAALGRLLDRAKSTVSDWPEKLPRGVQFELHVKTGGKLSVDAEFINQPFNQRIETNATA